MSSYTAVSCTDNNPEIIPETACCHLDVDVSTILGQNSFFTYTALMLLLVMNILLKVLDTKRHFRRLRRACTRKKKGLGEHEGGGEEVDQGG